MTEHRQHARAPIALEVRYRRLNAFFADYTRNVSRGGTFIRTSRPLPPATRFVFKLIVPGRAEPLELAGEVVRVVPAGENAGMGIRFVWDDEQRRAELEAVVERLMAESLGPHVAEKLLEKR
ncbi:MAG TPA: TIGR02266 family protein [Anaeromyxobacteraceae bacterium]|nr:TIGR02266 family protein [Anaeromyxobacteraceae bacterium]